MADQKTDAMIRAMLREGRTRAEIEGATGVCRSRIACISAAMRPTEAHRAAEIISRFESGHDRTSIAIELRVRAGDVARVLVAHDAMGFAMRDLAKGRARYDLINKFGVPRDIVDAAWAATHRPAARVALHAKARRLVTTTDDTPEGLALARRLMADACGPGGWIEGPLA
ncbi:MAG: hypothetical protein ACJA1L_000345 [Paracoccaceae bacterium]|jgi:hypothetical protein